MERVTWCKGWIVLQDSNKTWVWRRPVFSLRRQSLGSKEYLIMIFSFKSTINTGNDNLTETKIQQSHDPYLLYTDNYVYTCTCVYMYMCMWKYLYKSTYLSMYLSIYLSVCLCVYLYKIWLWRLWSGKGSQVRTKLCKI